LHEGSVGELRVVALGDSWRIRGVRLRR
jgi:hypothetical protein